MAKNATLNRLHVQQDAHVSDIASDLNKQIKDTLTLLKSSGHSCLTCSYTRAALGPKLVCTKKSSGKHIHLVLQGNICQLHKCRK